MVLPAEAAQLGGRHLDAYAGGEMLSEPLPGAHVTGVIVGGKLRNP